MGRAIEIRTELPGPRSRELLARKAQAVAAPLQPAFPIMVAQARGVLLTDVDGNTFADFTGGIGCLNVGHTHPRVVQAVREQVERFTHTDFTVAPYGSYVTLAERLAELAPISAPVRAAFFNSGAEAIENAVKIARAATGRPAVIAFEGGFHGRTLMALSLSSKTRPYKAGLGPFAPEVYRVPFADPYRGRSAVEALAALRQALRLQVAADRVAAIVFEPVQGESGFIVPPVEFVQGLRELADEHGIVLVADEVQTGFCRTGRMFALERFGVEPDLMAVAKSIAAGIPLSAVLGRAQLMDAPAAGAIGGTFGGNPVAIAAAHAVLDVMLEERLCERAERVGSVLRSRMESWQARFPFIGDVRGLGTMLALDLVRDRGSREPDPQRALAVVEAAFQRGLLLLTGGLGGNCIRTLVPLVIRDEELEQALAVWEEALVASATAPSQ